MDSPNFILLHWRNESLSFHTNLSVLHRKADTEATHDIRVAFKKLRAYARLLVAILPEKAVKVDFPATEDLFRVLGKQRDLEICQELLHRYESNGDRYSELKEYFETGLKQARRWSRQAIRDYDTAEIADAETRVLNATSTISVETLAERTVELIRSSFFGCEMYFPTPHKLRQNLKNVFYWVRILPSGHGLESLGDELHDVLDELGGWQDRQVFAIRTRHYRRDHVPKPLKAYARLKKLEEKNRVLAEGLLDSALKKLSRLLKSKAGGGKGAATSV
ncbi:MAG TPA: CHAD domain-containing protein [Chitinophagaceae bacterium]|nr:CHAD domain-containing protein [Chitinophagaceae bacterium]